jgi:hypothetical protein
VRDEPLHDGGAEREVSDPSFHAGLPELRRSSKDFVFIFVSSEARERLVDGGFLISLKRAYIGGRRGRR